MRKSYGTLTNLASDAPPCLQDADDEAGNIFEAG